MTEFVEVDDPTDPRVADYVALRDSQLRHSLESEHGLFIAEGEKIIRRAAEAGYLPRSFLLAPRWIPGLRDVLDRSDAPCFVVSEALAEQVTGFHVHRGALASFAREQRWAASELLAMRRVVVCEDIVDHANLGAIVRDAAGLGWDAVVLSSGCADPFYRRAVKASMGTVFAIPWARMDAGIEQVRAAGLELVATSLGDGSRDIDDVAAELRGSSRRVALLVGSEGPGLSSGWLDAADLRVTIPMARGVDSLNVAAATAVACHLLR